jgi:hypothetical protein
MNLPLFHERKGFGEEHRPRRASARLQLVAIWSSELYGHHWEYAVFAELAHPIDFTYDTTSP